MKTLYLCSFLFICTFTICKAQTTVYTTTYYAASLWQNDKTTVNAAWRSNMGCITSGSGANTIIQCPSGGITEQKAVDGEYAVCDYTDDETKFLMATNFKINFDNLPAGLTRENTEVRAIEVQVEKYATIRDIKDNQVRIIKHGVVNYNGFNISESDKAMKTVSWSKESQIVTYGGENNPYPLWGQTWELADLERADFGVAISAVKPKAQNNAKSYIGMIALRVSYAKRIQALPVTLVHFTAKPEAKQVVLNWATASEKNNDYFGIEKSADGREFKTIATVRGAGNSIELKEYQYVDETYSPKTVYYRLKQTDFDGTFAYSNIVAVNTKGEFEPTISVYPNPSDGKNLKIAANFLHQAPTELLIYNQTGALIYKSEIAPTTQQDVPLQPICNFAPGIYFMVLSQQDIKLKEKIIIH